VGVGVPGLVEPLSEREIELSRLLAAGQPNRRSPRSCSSRWTPVKMPISHLLATLGATNRTEATARARELGLPVDAAEPRRTGRS
jgi:LuxR family transcriptional regulator, maltose regulon positive regulatory protein